MAYATADELRLLLGMDTLTSEQTTRAELVLDLATGEVEDEVGQSLEEAEDTVVLDGPTLSTRWHEPPGTGSRDLVLPRWPVTAVSSVTILHDDQPAETLSEGTDADYTWSADGIVTRVNAWWPTWDRSVEVTYTAGYDPVPAAARRIVLRVAATGWDNPRLLRSESIGDYSRGWGSGAVGLALTEADRRLLGRYRARV